MERSRLTAGGSLTSTCNAGKSLAGEPRRARTRSLGPPIPSPPLRERTHVIRTFPCWNLTFLHIPKPHHPSLTGPSSSLTSSLTLSLFRHPPTPAPVLYTAPPYLLLTPTSTSCDVPGSSCANQTRTAGKRHRRGGPHPLAVPLHLPYFSRSLRTAPEQGPLPTSKGFLHLLSPEEDSDPNPYFIRPPPGFHAEAQGSNSQ